MKSSTGRIGDRSRAETDAMLYAAQARILARLLRERKGKERAA